MFCFCLSVLAHNLEVLVVLVGTTGNRMRDTFEKTFEHGKIPALELDMWPVGADCGCVE